MIPQKIIYEELKGSPGTKISVNALFIAGLLNLVIMTAVFAVCTSSATLNGSETIVSGRMNDIRRLHYPDYPVLAEWSFSTSDDTQVGLSIDTTLIPTKEPTIDVKKHDGILPTKCPRNNYEANGMIKNFRKKFRCNLSTRTNPILSTTQFNAPDSIIPAISSIGMVLNIGDTTIGSTVSQPYTSTQEPVLIDSTISIPHKRVIRNRKKSTLITPSIMDSVSKLRLAQQTTKALIQYKKAPELNSMHFPFGIRPRAPKNVRTYVPHPQTIAREKLDDLIREAQAEANEERKRKEPQERYKESQSTVKHQDKIHNKIHRVFKKSHATHAKRRRHMQGIILRRFIKKRDMKSKLAIERRISGKGNLQKYNRIESGKSYRRLISGPKKRYPRGADSRRERQRTNKSHKKVTSYKTISRKHSRRKENSNMEDQRRRAALSRRQRKQHRGNTTVKREVTGVKATRPNGRENKKSKDITKDDRDAIIRKNKHIRTEDKISELMKNMKHINATGVNNEMAKRRMMNSWLRQPSLNIDQLYRNHPTVYRKVITTTSSDYKLYGEWGRLPGPITWIGNTMYKKGIPFIPPEEGPPAMYMPIEYPEQNLTGLVVRKG